MKLLTAILFVAAVAAAPPPRIPNSASEVSILSSENYNAGDGKHRYSFETSDGTKQEQQGELINAGSKNAVYVTRGSFVWYSPEGIKYVVSYVADENGYQPEYEEAPGAPSPAVLAALLGPG